MLDSSVGGVWIPGIYTRVDLKLSFQKYIRDCSKSGTRYFSPTHPSSQRSWRQKGIHPSIYPAAAPSGYWKVTVHVVVLTHSNPLPLFHVSLRYYYYSEWDPDFTQEKHVYSIAGHGLEPRPCSRHVHCCNNHNTSLLGGTANSHKCLFVPSPSFRQYFVPISLHSIFRTWSLVVRVFDDSYRYVYMKPTLMPVLFIHTFT